MSWQMQIHVLYLQSREQKVVDGPFGFGGTVEKNVKKRKLEVMVKIGRKTPFEGFMQVEKYNICYI
jgi:hypothetical protein